MKAKLLLLLLLTVGYFNSDGQTFYNFRRNRNLIVTVGSGIAAYKGEMVNPGEFGKIKANIVLGTEYFFADRFSARGELTYFRISGDDSNANSDRVERNLSFFSDNIELSFTGTVNMIPVGTRFYQRPKFNLFAFGGVGLLYMNPKTTYDGKTYALQPLMTENVKYSRIQPVIPVGIGIKYMVNPFINVLVEGGYRITFTDYLDDVSSKRYTNPVLLKSDLARALADRRQERIDNVGGDQSAPAWNKGVRGNPDSNDGYFLINVKIQYYLPYEIFQDNSRKLLNKKRKYYYRRPKGQ